MNNPIEESTQKTLNFIINKLNQMQIDGRKVASIDIRKNEILLYNETNPNDVKTISIKNNQNQPEHSDNVTSSEYVPPVTILSDTSVMNSQNNIQQPQQGGGKNIFYSNKYSLTSEQNYTNAKSDGYSATSTIGYNGFDKLKGGNAVYSETSTIGHNGFDKLKRGNAVYSETSTIGYNGFDKLKGGNGVYSETSTIGHNGFDKLKGGNGVYSETSDVIDFNSLNNKKNKKSSNTTNLNVDIFRKAIMKGGTANQDINNKMREYGIKSTSTSSVCE
jgi:hypothetical protein